ncbi:MAG: tetratricopeptide repeat-containing protein [Verrucomicrobiota bacterium]
MDREPYRGNPETPSAEAPLTLDLAYARVRALAGKLRSAEHLRPRELRRLWETRARPFWRLDPGLYESLAQRFIEAGENYSAMEVTSEGRGFFENNAALLFKEALAGARSGAVERAWRILQEHWETVCQLPDAPALLGRIFKDAWKATGEPRHLEQAFTHYSQAYQKGLNPAFTGVNVASIALLLGKKELSQKTAAAVLAYLDTQSDGRHASYWDAVTRAECHLVQAAFEQARSEYLAAARLPDAAKANLVTTRAQCRLLLSHHGLQSRAMDACFPLPLVACFSGHRIDGSERVRFPAWCEEAVASEITALLEKLWIGIGFSSAANGADILFLEALRNLGGETFVTLPMPPAEFKKGSVEIPDTLWGTRFDKALRLADAVAGLDLPATMEPGEAFEYCNKICLGSALQKARELDADLVVIVVWDGTHGARGGTGQFVELVRKTGIPLEVIHPMGKPVSLVLPHAATEEPEYPILASLAFSLANGGSMPSGERLLKSLIGEYREAIVHLSEQCGNVQLFLNTTATAAHLALTLLEAVLNGALRLDSAIGLHAGPVPMPVSPLTDSPEPAGPHALQAQKLARIEPLQNIYASAAFASLAQLEPPSGSRFEYLGERSLDSRVPAQAVLRLVGGGWRE